jgi:penicillin amidase
MIITANENLTSLEYPYPEAIGYEWSDPVRGDRIAELFGNDRKMTMTDMMQMQNDHLSIPARTILPLLKGLAIEDSNLDKIRNQLLNWNCMMDITSVEATIYNEWEQELKSEVYKIKVPTSIHKYIGSLQSKKLVDFLTFPDGDFGPDPVISRDQLLIKCLTNAIKNIGNKLGADQSNWQYGQERYKHVYLTHALGIIAEPTMQSKLNVGPLPRGGSGSTVGNTGSNLNQTSGATFKIISDTEDWDRTLAINAPGQSGNPDDKHYADLFELWARDHYFPLFYTRIKVESVSDRILYLVPK